MAYRSKKQLVYLEGNPCLLNPAKAHQHRHQHAFNVCLIQRWNKLPEGTVNASSVETLKARLDAKWQLLVPGVLLKPLPLPVPFSTPLQFEVTYLTGRSMQLFNPNNRKLLDSDDRYYFTLPPPLPT